MGGGLLVDFDPVVLDGNAVTTSCGVLLDGYLDSCHLLGLDQGGTVFDQGNNAAHALANREASWQLWDQFTLALVCATKGIARLAAIFPLCWQFWTYSGSSAGSMMKRKNEGTLK
jgi:hypothetical protein